MKLKLSDEEIKAVREAADRSNVKDVARYPAGFDIGVFIDTPAL